MSTTRSSSLLEEANTAAHEISLDWIRTVFQELCYQLWKENFNVDHVGNEGNTKRCRLNLTVEMMEKAQLVCRRLAGQWSQKMKAAGHFQAASWIQSVAQDEASTFYTSAEEAADGSDSEDEESNEEENPEEIPIIPEANTVTPLAALGQLKLPIQEGCRLTTQQQEQYIIKHLDDMGYSGKTYWPFDWEIIEEAARKLPQQLYTGSHSAEYGNTLKLKLVPKSSTPAEGQEEGVAGSGKTKKSKVWTESMVVEYKQMRPYYKRKGQNDSDPNKRRKTNTPTFPKETPRPPLDLGHSKIPWNAKEVADPALDDYIHPEESATPTNAHVLLGALKPIGHVHHYLQSRIDHGEDSMQHANDRKLKLRYANYTKERIGKHQLEKVVTTKTIRSKIKYSLKEDGLDDDTAVDPEESGEMPRWWDLDLGECLLDLQEPGASTSVEASVPARKLYAFSSLEICLAHDDGGKE